MEPNPQIFELISILSEEISHKEANELAKLADDGLHKMEVERLLSKMQQWESDSNNEFEDLIESGYNTKENSELFSKLSKWEAENPASERAETTSPKPKIRKLWNRRYILLAASIALMVTFWFLITNDQNSSNDSLFSKYYAEYPHGRSFRGVENPSILELERTTFSQYDRQEYNLAEVGFQELINLKPEDDELNLFLGISQLNNEKYVEAIQSFETFINSNPTAFQGMWYLALTYLKLENYEEAEKYLILIENGDDNYYKAKANELLIDLN